MSKKVRDKRRPKCRWCGRTLARISKNVRKCPKHDYCVIEWEQRPEFQGLQAIRTSQSALSKEDKGFVKP